jgi:hypothetical protein
LSPRPLIAASKQPVVEAECILAALKDIEITAADLLVKRLARCAAGHHPIMRFDDNQCEAV